MSLVLLPVMGCVLFGVWYLQPRFFAGTQTLQVSQPVCGVWQATSGSVFGPRVPNLYGLEVLAEDDIWGLGTGTTLYHWNGSGWQNIDLPAPGPGSEADLADIAALPDGQLWAVGSYEHPHQVEHTLTYRMAGGEWTRVESPDVEAASTTLYSVAGTTKDDVWAVGSYTTGYQSHALVLHWDGARWTRVEGLSECPGDQDLSGVLAFSPSDAWAVGSCSLGQLGSLTETTRTLVQHWDGSAWNVVPSPNHTPGPYIDSSSLRVVAGAGSQDLWAAGHYWDSDGRRGYWTQPMLQHWDGKQWSEVSFAHPGTHTTASLSDVLALSPNDVWALGSYSAGWLHPFATHWDGKQWSEVPVPNPLSEGLYRTIAPVSEGKLWAAGFGFDNEDGAYYGLLARFGIQACPAP
jgi:hypothetical protein